MTPTLTQPARIVRLRSKKVKSRKAALARSQHTYEDLRRVAGVTYSMTWKWMNGERVSERIARAFRLLTGRDA